MKHNLLCITLLTSPLTCSLALANTHNNLHNPPHNNPQNQTDDSNLENFNYFNNLSLEELFDVTVTLASKTEESLFDVPSSISVLNGKEIKRWGIESLQDVLNYVPGFYVSREVEQGNGSKISVRGRNTALSEYVLFLINGQRINDIYSGGATLINRKIAVDNIDRIEVIRGPGSALYGSNAFLAVINIITATEQNNLSLFVDSNQQFAGSVSLSGEQQLAQQQLKWSLHASGFEDEGEHYRQVNSLYGQGETWDGNGGIDFNLSLQTADLSLFARHMERTAEDFLTFGSLGNGINDEQTTQSSVIVKYDTLFFDKLQTHWAMEYVEEHWDSIALLLPAGIATPTDFIGGPILDSSSLAFTADFQYRLNPAVLFNFGVAQSHDRTNRIRSRFNYSFDLSTEFPEVQLYSPTHSFNKEAEREITGLYFQAKYQPNDSLTIFVGARHDHYNDFGNNTSPRVALIYALDAKNTLKLMVGESFRAPNFLELFDRNNPVDFGNPELNAEKAKTLELAYGHQADNGHYNLTLFRTSIDSQIEFGQIAPQSPLNPFGSPTFINANGSPKTSGIELDFKASITDELMLSGGFSHFFSHTSGSPHPYGNKLTVPKRFGFASLSYTYQSWELGSTMLLRDQTPALTTTSGYALFNLNARYNLSESAYLEFIGDNIFNRQYFTYSTVGLALPNRGSRFGFKAVLTF